MPRRTFNVMVTPAVLKWARESSGIGAEEAAKRISTSTDVLFKWEAGERQPTLRILEKLAAYYKRPLAAFFLPSPPPEPALPPDFRVLPRDQRQPLSRKTLLAIRQARSLQARAAELLAEMEPAPASVIGKLTVRDDPETAAANARTSLGVTVEEQVRWNGAYPAFRRWRQAIEARNILVFQLPMPVNEARGFSLSDRRPTVITVNSSDAIQARIFTLFHEYGHLLLDSGGICLPSACDTHTEGARAEEPFCNRFAAALLVPRDALTSQVGTTTRTTIDRETLRDLAIRFKVSRQVVLRRLWSLGLISQRAFQTKVRELEAEAPPKPRKGGPRRTLAEKCLDERGASFAHLVLDAKAKDLITRRDMLDYLAVRVKHLNRVEALLKGRSADA